MKVCIIGTGYVGLVSGACLAAKGHQVRCADRNPEIVAALNEGRAHFFEEGLAEVLASVLLAKRFVVTDDLVSGLDGAEIAIIAVGTPSIDGVIDLSDVCSVARAIGAYIGNTERHISVVVKSTVLPCTTDTVVRKEIEAASGKLFPAFGLGMNPEFLREGNAIADFMEPDRIVIGFEDGATLERLERLYAPWETDKIRIPTRSAELLKYANNIMLACQISAINEIANLAAAIGGIDIMDVVKGVHLDKRWNPILPDRGRAQPEILTYLVPGCGFGGSCFPKDVQALRSHGEQLGLSMHMLNAVLDINDVQPEQVVSILHRERGDLDGCNVLVLGLAFKPGTDDVRESASLKIVEQLLSHGCKVSVHDPIAADNFRRALGGTADALTFLDDWRSNIDQAEVVILATEWPQYQEIATLDLSGKIFFDGRRALTPNAVPSAKYLAIGRRAVFEPPL
jgi:UDPglucose 6-dehydrogenase